MKIGIDARLWGTKNAGIGRYVEELVKNLQLIDSKNQYVLFCRGKDFSDIPEKKNFRKVVANIPHYTLREQVLLPGIFEKEKLDLLHVPHFNVPIGYKGRFVVTIHDILWHQTKGLNVTTLPAPLYLIKYLGYRWVIKNAVTRAEKVIVPSNTVKLDLVERFVLPQEKVIVTYEGVSNKRYHVLKHSNNKVLSKYGVKGNYLLYVGSLYPHKNVEALVRAVRLLRVTSRAAPGEPRLWRESRVTLIVVCGRSIFWEKFKKFVEQENAESFVKLVGYVGDEELGVLYKNAQAFVFPTLSEGFGLPGLEAMATGTPVVCSGIPVLREVYGDAALYFDPRDANDIADKVMQILTDKGLVKGLVNRGELRVKNYSWRKMAKETLEVYNYVSIS